MDVLYHVRVKYTFLFFNINVVHRVHRVYKKGITRCQKITTSSWYHDLSHRIQSSTLYVILRVMHCVISFFLPKDGTSCFIPSLPKDTGNVGWTKSPKCSHGDRNQYRLKDRSRPIARFEPWFLRSTVQHPNCLTTTPHWNTLYVQVHGVDEDHSGDDHGHPANTHDDSEDDSHSRPRRHVVSRCLPSALSISLALARSFRHAATTTCLCECPGTSLNPSARRRWWLVYWRGSLISRRVHRTL